MLISTDTPRFTPASPGYGYTASRPATPAALHGTAPLETLSSEALDPSDGMPALHTDLVQGLLDEPAHIAPKYFYDAHGSHLFEAITQLPEYYLTRTETALMQLYARDIAAAVGPGCTLIELGAGSCQKARALCQNLAPACFVAVDICADFLQEAVADLRRDFPHLDVRAVGADMTQGVPLPPDVARDRRLVFYPGSSIGNFDPEEALALLVQMRGLIDGDGGLLIGFDLPKETAVLQAAYDDALGVTAAFNLNVLTHVNQLLGSNFVLSQWQHRAFFNLQASRIEMHLQARQACTVHWPGGARRFAQGECIHTENSYKYPLGEFTGMLRRAGFSRTRAWTDDRQWFAVVLARP